MTEPRPSTGVEVLLGDLRGGLTGVAIALAIVLPLGALTFGALGATGLALGVRAVLVATMVGLVVMALVGGATIPSCSPPTATTLIYAAFIATLGADPRLQVNGGHDVPRLLLLGSLCVALAGVIQCALAGLRAGSLVKFIPRPVVAGFMNGIAILIVVSQARPLLGLPPTVALTDFPSVAGSAKGAAMLVGGATLVLVLVLWRRWPTTPWALLGLVAGTAAAVAVHQAIPGADLGLLLGAPTLRLPDGMTWQAMPNVLSGGIPAAHLALILTTGTVLGVVGAMDALLAAVGTDAATGTRHDSNRLLLGQGIANLVGSVLGGVPVSYSSAIAIRTRRAGGRPRVVAVLIAVGLAATLFFGGAVLAQIPVAVSAAVMIVVALGLVDRWSHDLWLEFRARRNEHHGSLQSLAIVAAVGLVTVFVGFVASIAVGTFLSMALFIKEMNRSLVRSVTTGATRRSRRVYLAHQDRILRNAGASIQVIEVEGAIFFGTIETLQREVERLAADARFVIVDLRRLTTIDASGAVGLQRLSVNLAAHGATLLLAGIDAGDRHGRALRAAGAFPLLEERTWFADVDRALEHAEQALLAAANALPPPEAEVPFGNLALARDLDASQAALLRRVVVRQDLAAAEVLFRAGEAGDRLYVLARGSVSILAAPAAGHASVPRLATFVPGVIFGEAAMLDGGNRTATAVADLPSVVYALRRADLDAICRSDPAIGCQVLLNIARELSAHMRNAAAIADAANR